MGEESPSCYFSATFNPIDNTDLPEPKNAKSLVQFDEARCSELLDPLNRDIPALDSIDYLALHPRDDYDGGALFDGPSSNDTDGEPVHPLGGNKFIPHQGGKDDDQFDQSDPAFNKSYLRNDGGTAEKDRLMQDMKDQVDELKQIWETYVNKMEPSLEGELDACIPAVSMFESFSTVSIKERFNDGIVNLFRVHDNLAKCHTQDMRRSVGKVSNPRKTADKILLQRKHKDPSKSGPQKAKDTNDPNGDKSALGKELHKRAEEVQQFQRSAERSSERVDGPSKVPCPGDNIALTDDVTEPTLQTPMTQLADLKHDLKTRDERIQELEKQNRELEKIVESEKRITQALESSVATKDKEIQSFRLAKQKLKEALGYIEQDVKVETQEHAPHNVTKHPR